MRLLFYIILLLLLIISCGEEIVNVKEPCVDCIEYSYQQAYNDTFIVLSLEAGIYCIGDSAWLISESDGYWTEINGQEFIDLMVESEYCVYYDSLLVINGDTIE